MRRTKKILKWTFIVVGGLVAILLIVNAILVWTTGSRLERELAKIRAAGDPVSLADIRFEPIPPEQNAATYLRRAREGVRAIDSEVSEAWTSGPTHDVRSEESLKATRSTLEAYPQVIPLLEKAANCPGYGVAEPFGPTGASDPNAAVAAQLEHIQENRSVARVLGMYRVNMLLSEGRRDEAARSAITMFKLTRHFDREPFLVGLLVSMTYRRIAFEGLNEALQSGTVSEDVRKELDDELAKHDMTRALHENLKTERALGLDMFRTFPWDRVWFTRAYSNRLKIQYLAQLDWFLAETSGDPAAARTLASPPQYDKTLDTLVLPALDAVENAAKHMTSELNAVRVLNALQRRTDPEKLPAADLSDLGLPKEATLDAFTGKPLIVKKVPGGWLIYSVGPNGQDGGGKVSSEDREPLEDIGFAPPKAQP